jgi:hypothetical protein
MADGAVGRRHAERRMRPRVRTGVVSTSAGILLTLLTTALCVANAISTLQAIALAVPAIVGTLGGWISVTVPDAWIAWRRGFQQGCKVAMSSQISSAPDKSTVTDLLARHGSRSKSRTQRGDGF